MINRSQSIQRRVRNAAASIVESLEARAYLTGVVFGNPVNNSPTLSPVFANLADFNGDGKADLFVANSTNSVSVFLSDGTGSFGSPVTIPVSGTPLPLATGAFVTAQPGNLDIVAGTSGTPGDVSLILGNGNGTFQAANNVPALDSNQAIAVGDFNNDGNMDVITVSGNSTPTNNAMLLLGNGTGGLTAQAPFSLPFGNVGAVAVGDFNGDGNLDIVVVNQQNNDVSVLLGNGNGTFQAPVSYPTGPTPSSIVVGDFLGGGNAMLTNGTNKPALDIVTADRTGGEISFLQNNGSGGFDAPVNSAVAGSPAGYGPIKIRTANFTSSSGNQDLVALLNGPSGTADADVMLSNGNGTWRSGNLIATNGGKRNAIAAGDINGDGLTDVVLTDSSLISALLNTTNQDTSTPTATVDGSQANGSTLSSTYDFTVTYGDSEQIDASTLGNGNLTVTPPGGSPEAATLVSTNLGNAATVHATYQISFPSDLTTANNGVYAVSMNASSVKNAGGIAVPAGSIGSFTLNVVSQNTTPPSATIDVVQPPGSNQSTVYDFNVTYTDPLAVNASTLGNGNLVVTFPGNSQSEAATLISTGLTNGPVVHATYQITFSQDLTTADNGGYQVSVNASSVKDTTGLSVPAGSIGAFTLTVTNPDTIAPTAAVDASQATPSTSTNTYNFTVTYSDNVAVNPNSLSNSNLTVTYPDGTQHSATYVSQTSPSATTIDATYQVAFGANISSSNNGTYNVTIAANSVTDTSGNPVAAGHIGSFAFAIGGVAPTGDFAVSAPTGKFSTVSSVVTSSKQKGGATVVITYNGTATLSKATVTTTLYASATQIHDGSAVQVGTPIPKKVGKLKPGKTFHIHFAPFLYPGTAGSYYLVSDVALNGTLDSYDGATPSPINVQAAYVDADAIAATPVKNTLAVGTKASAIFTLENIGNSPITGGVTVDVGLVPAGSPLGTTPTVIATAIPVKLHLNSSQTKKVHVTFTPATLPVSGSYELVLHVNVVGETLTSNNEVFSTVVITI